MLITSKNTFMDLCIIAVSAGFIKNHAISVFYSQIGRNSIIKLRKQIIRYLIHNSDNYIKKYPKNYRIY